MPFGNIAIALISFWFFALPIDCMAMPAKNLDRAIQLDGLSINMMFHVKDSKGQTLDVVPLNQLISIVLSFKIDTKTNLKPLLLNKFDVSMPEHKHGMQTRVKITKLSNQEFLIEGIKLHMPGAWQINVQAQYDSQSLQVAIPLKL